MAVRKKLHIAVSRKISTLIMAGEFQVGSRLPAERKLAQRFDVSRVTIHEAIVALEAKKEVIVKAGSGVYVLGEHLVSSGFSREISAYELFEAFALLEGEAAALAARMMISDEIKELEKALRNIELGDFKETSFDEAVRQFHTIIAQATHNSVIAEQIGFLWDIQENIKHKSNAHKAVCVEEDRDARIAGYVTICDAIANGDVGAARTAMRDHFAGLLEAMHDAFEYEALEAAKLEVKKMRYRFSIGESIAPPY